jgi:hypothetical protein
MQLRYYKHYLVVDFTDFVVEIHSLLAYRSLDTGTSRDPPHENSNPFVGVVNPKEFSSNTKSHKELLI